MEGWRLYICFGVALLLNAGGGRAGEMLGAVDIRVTNVESCPDPEQYRYSVQVARRKLSRTEEAYSFNISLDIPIDENIGIYANIAKLVDGGYKPNAYELSEDNICDFAMKHSKETFSQVLSMAGVEPACPVPPGEYSVIDFVVDYDTIPETMLYGDFRCDTYATLNGERILCVRSYVSCTPKKTFGMGMGMG